MSFDLEHQSARGEMELMEGEARRPPLHQKKARRPPPEEDEARSATWRDGCLSSSKSFAGVFFKFLAAALSMAVVAMVPVLLPLFLIVMFSLPKKTMMRITRMDKRWKEGESEDDGGIGGAYNRARRKESLLERIRIGSLAMIARASLMALVWLALSLLIPSLRDRAMLLGSPMWKWSLLCVTLTAGYYESLFLSGVLLLPTLLLKGTTAFYAQMLIPSITHVGYFGLVLGSWIAYFRTHNGLGNPHGHDNHKAFEYVTWTFVSLLVGSVLWLLKNLLLLKWTVDVIYRRFEPRISITSLKFYFIGILAAGFDGYDIVAQLKLLNSEHPSSSSSSSSSSNVAISKYVMSRKISLLHLRYRVHVLISLAQIMSHLLDHQQDDQEAVVTWFNQQIRNDTSSDTCTPDGLLKLFRVPKEEVETPELVEGDVELPKLPIWKRTWKKFMICVEDPKVKTEKILKIKRKINKEMANILWRLVGEECSTAHSFTFDHLKIWMVDAHKDCINMGRTLADAKAIITRLDIFMSFVIFMIVLLLWFLITGVSSTTVLVTVATPFLALTFIFGDSAKTFFQGLIFCFATHPFDVGDRCILDNVELEVKSINILTTTFIKIGSNEKRLYPNSVLATNAIVNLGWQPDPKDMVELPLSSSTNLDALKMKITKFFEEENKRYENTYSLTISEVGENIKVQIHFSHILTIHDLSHSQCFKKKKSQRSDFLFIIKKYINESRIEEQNGKDPSQSAASTTTNREIIEVTNEQK